VSDTPRTDAEEYEFSLSPDPEYMGPTLHVESSFARTLERELAAARAEIAALNANAITGTLVRAGTFGESGGEVTGLLIEIPKDELRAIKRLPMFERVTITTGNGDTK